MLPPPQLISDESGAARERLRAPAWARPPLGGSVRFSLGLLGLALVLRLVAMHGVVLTPEEAYYWMYAQHPALSYFDHPPMVAWVILAGTWVFGDTEFGVRIVGNLLMCAASVLLYHYGRMWYGRQAGLLAAAALLVFPVYFGAGFIATMDAPLMFFWVACLLGVSLALRTDRPAWWYLAGAAMGAAMLSKYTGVFLGVGGALAVMATPRYRRHLRTVHPYLAGLLALVIFAPVVAWNAQHDWASFRFQSVGRFARGSFDIADPLRFIWLQVVVATPVLLIGTILLSARLLRRRRLTAPRWWIAMCFSLPLLAVMAYSALRHTIHINWTLPAYLSLLPAVAHWAGIAARHARLKRGRRDGLRGVAWTAAACTIINVGLLGYLLAGQPRLWTISAFGPWRELALLVEEYEDRMEAETGQEPLIVADGKYRLASVLAFYRTPLEDRVAPAHFTSSRWLLGGSGLGFAYWLRAEDWLGKPMVCVGHGGGLAGQIKGRFDRAEIIDDSRLRSLGYEAARCYGYRGRRD
jgi:dolichol-phosphate mannosyltransferase